MSKQKSIMTASKILIMAPIGLALACWFAFGNWAQSSQDQKNSDDFGRVKGILIDAQTGEPANEAFRIFMYDSLMKVSYNAGPLRGSFETDAYGRFDFQLKPGSYYLQFIPKSFSSKYESEPCILISDREKIKINVFKGKITRVQKSVRHGGTLKILLVDALGNNFNPTSLLRGSEVDTTLRTDNLLGDPSSWGEDYLLNLSGGDGLDDGEAVVHRLPEGEYSCRVFFGNIGFGAKTITGIRIKMDETTVCKIMVDLNDATGITGKITDQQGMPVSNLIIEMHPVTETCYFGKYKTDATGNYRIVGLSEGTYKMEVMDEYSVKNRIYESVGNIFIHKSKIVQKNVTVKRP